MFDDDDNEQRILIKEIEVSFLLSVITGRIHAIRRNLENHDEIGSEFHLTELHKYLSWYINSIYFNREIILECL